MTYEHYNGLDWEVEDFPIGSSTPDELYELLFRAHTTCPNCGERMEGEASYWSRDEDMLGAWLNGIDYDECENCEPEEDLDLDS